MLNFIARNTPKVKDNFIIKLIESDNGRDCYEVYAEDKKIVLAGNSNLSLCMAFYRYLNECCNVVITDGDYDISYIATTPLPTKKFTRTVKQKIRARTSYEMFSLEGNYWGFDRWEKEIDFMAMHGINTAFQPVGFDGVLYRTLREIGFAEDAAIDFMSGPAFLMRQLTGNVAAMNSVHSKEYLERKIYIGKKITEREKELGITPVLPALIPSVPFNLRRKYMKMDIFKAPMWYNFPPIFYIKAENAFFEIFNRKFLEIQRDSLGETDAFLFEPLYDVDKKGYNSHLVSIGQALTDSLAQHNPDAVCYTHLSSISEDFFKKASPEKFIIINDSKEERPQFLQDKKHLVAIKGNSYGRTGLCGDIDTVSRCPYAVSKSENLLGTALEIDTFSENPMYCAVALHATTANEAFDADEFVKDYACKRYRTEDFADEIIRLKNLCYNTDECSGSIICARPSTRLKHTAPYDTLERKYECSELFEIARDIVESDTRKNDKMRLDIVCIIRQLLGELAYPIYLKATEFFKAENVRNYEQASNLFLEICQDMDRLLKTQESLNLSSKFEEAHALGNNKDEQQSIDLNFLMYHTIWGPIDRSILYDTAWCELGGLVKDFYAQRWFMYFRALAAYFDNPKKLKDFSRKQPLDRHEYKKSYQHKRLALFENNFLENYIPRKDGIGEEDTLEVAKEILEKYSEVVYQF
ncbi:MAG: alpha-N-acetylglucosaminidase C-terminal domain-containing protein [Clostridia bacterium]|nr:alpha-N-acetylglucosaminidase C-terminal domain-containing protein [Clostridia bacterium]